VITIDGFAPNASKVTVEINNFSYDFNVSQSGNFRFTTSQLTINKGMNTVKFKVTNGGQVIETTRQVTLYNGEVTYFDERLENNGNSYALSYNGDYTVDMTKDLILRGKAIIPLPLYDVAEINANPTPTPGPGATPSPGPSPVDVTKIADVIQALEDNMSIAISGQTTNPNVSIVGLEPSSLNANLKYVTVEYSYTLPSTLPFNTPNAFTLKAPNSMQFDTSS